MPETKEVVESLRTTKFASKHAKLIGDAITELESKENRCNELKQQLSDSIRDCEQLQKELREKVVCRSVYDRMERDLMTLWRKQKSFSNSRLQFFSFGIIAGVFVSIVIDFLFSTR
jgi:hypothetical protein